MPTPLVLETAKEISTSLKIELAYRANFTEALARLHENKPHFTEDLLELIETAQNLRKQI